MTWRKQSEQVHFQTETKTTTPPAILYSTTPPPSTLSPHPPPLKTTLPPLLPGCAALVYYPSFMLNRREEAARIASLPDELDVDSSSDTTFDDTVSMKSTSPTTSSMWTKTLSPQAFIKHVCSRDFLLSYTLNIQGRWRKRANVPFPDEHEIEEDQDLVRKLASLSTQEEGCKQDEGCKSVENEYRVMNQVISGS